MHLQEWNIKLENTLRDPKSRIAWNSGRAHCNVAKRSVHYDDMSRIGCSIDGDNISDNARSNDKQHTHSILKMLGFGRNKHKDEATDDGNTATNASQQIPLQDVVKSYFEQHGIKRYQITQLQFLNANPGSSNQIWHRDNTQRGLTAIIALKDVGKNGPTELISQSHRDDFTLWSPCLDVLQSYLPSNLRSNEKDVPPFGSKLCIGPILGCLDAGDTILYDARILHRGRGYDCTKKAKGDTSGCDKDRPVLVLRCDATLTPPPGTGIITTTATKYVGSMLYATLFGFESCNPCGNNSDDKE